MSNPIVKILLPGYVSAESGGHSCSTVTLVQTDDKNIIVDPGTLSNPQILLDKLTELNLTPEQIDIVFITHSHPDHYRQIGMFPKAKMLDYWGWWIDDVCEDYKNELVPNIEIIKTPGHSSDSVTVIVKIDKGKIAICGDVFWKENFPVDDPYASEKDKLTDSRKKIIEIADWIIPGHGEMFKTK